jgi:hypothetical protein
MLFHLFAIVLSYVVFGEEYEMAIRKTSERYEKAMREAKNEHSQALYKARADIASHEFFQNCTDEKNNTMCKNVTDEPGNIIVAIFIFMIPVITLLALVNAK